MLNFDFYNPTNVIFGKEAIGKLSCLVPDQARVLVLYGQGSIKRTGLYDAVMSALHSHVTYEFSGISPNPEVTTLVSAITCVKENHIDFLLAVGGGSVIDSAKYIAAAALIKEDHQQIFEHRGSTITEALPFGCVLTLPATGSEMNCSAVITTSAQAKLPFSNRLLYPKFSLLDPTATFTLPTKQVGNGVVDAFVHVTEQYLTFPVNAKVQDRFAEGLLMTLIEEGPKALTNAEDYDVRANLMWSATLALNGLISAGVPGDWATHLIGHELTALYGIDHAQSLAVVLPSLLRECKQNKREKLLQYAARVWQLTDADEEHLIEKAILCTEVFFERMGVKTRLSDYGLNQTHICEIIDSLNLHGRLALGEHRDITLARVKNILEKCI